MKKAILLVLFASLMFAGVRILDSQIPRERKQVHKPAPSATGMPVSAPSLAPVSRERFLFVPYWSLADSSYRNAPYDTFYYFGIAANAEGISTEEAGYEGLEAFVCPEGKRCELVLRLLDGEINRTILKDRSLQERIIRDSIAVADRYGFSGIALDLELSSLSLADTAKQINGFVQEYSDGCKTGYKTFSVIVYGDVFYRKRPYDVAFISKHSDRVLVMAYDFHKSYGEPGPNFPFDRRSEGGSSDYGYDFRKMVEDFKREASAGKLGVILGMYGYDWTLNNQGTPLKQATAITVNQVESLKTRIPNAKITVQDSKEKKIEYEDEQSRKHVVWYEDGQSAKVKTGYLESEGINHAGFWAWGYF